MEIKVNALVVRAVDYKDNDKILTLYSLEKGKITAGIKGVKKSGAKLKFASEPFCFAEFILAKKGERYTVTNATYIDSFYNLRTSLEKYYLSAVILDTVNALIEQDSSDILLFNLILNAVKGICYSDNERAILCKYLYSLCEINGYGILNTSCKFCGKNITNRVFFRYSDASFSCLDCFNNFYKEITMETYENLKIIKSLSFEEIQNSQKESIKTTKLLKFLFYYLSLKTEVKINSFEVITSQLL